MRLGGLHHVTMITADAPRCVEFHAGTLGLRLVKQTVNFDQPDAYHLYFGDEQGSPGSILTWFEFPGAAPGRPGTGMIHVIELGVSGVASLDFWAQRLTSAGASPRRESDRVRFTDSDGLAFELVVADADRDNPPLRAEHPEIPSEHAVVGVEGARAYASPELIGERSELLIDTLGFAFDDASEYRLAGDEARDQVRQDPDKGRPGFDAVAAYQSVRTFRWAYDPAPSSAGIQGAGSVHHIAWACTDAEQPAWQEQLRGAGRQVTPVLDRDYFRSIYFREPRGVLFEIATLSPGFATDEDPAHLGEALRLPAQHEHLRSRLEEVLTPLENPRVSASRRRSG